MIHVVPVNDLEEHDTSFLGTHCHCKPELNSELTNELTVIHNSFDGREFVERADEILGNEHRENSWCAVEIGIATN